MGFLHDLKRKMLQKQMIAAEKTRKKREEYIKKEMELKRLRDKVTEAKRLKLSPSEQAFNKARLQKKATEAKKRKEQWIKTRDRFGRTAKSIAGNITGVAKTITKEEPKRRRKKTVKRKRKRRTTTKRRRRRTPGIFG